MTVAELIEALSQFPGDMRVIAGTDDEGNDFIDPWTPGLSWCAENDTSSGWRPVHEDDIANGEYDTDELVQMVVM